MSQKLPTPFDVKLMNMTASALFLAFALLVVGSVAAWAASHPVFAISSISVTGEVTHNNAATLRANVTPQLAGTFFTLDLSAARLVFEAVPWVRKAVVHREFPNHLRVQLQEHKAIAYWGSEGESRMLNSFGEVFEANVGEVDQDLLPRLSGPDGQATQVLAMYRALQPQFEEFDMTLEELEMTGNGGWRAQLDEGAVIELGSGGSDEIERRMQRFLKTLNQVAAHYGRRPDALEAADLRHEDGYAIRLRGVTTLAVDVQKKK